MKVYQRREDQQQDYQPKKHRIKRFKLVDKGLYGSLLPGGMRAHGLSGLMMVFKMRLPGLFTIEFKSSSFSKKVNKWAMPVKHAFPFVLLQPFF